MMKKRVLFICIHNSARSQMAEALLNEKCGDVFEAESAGLEPGTLNPLAVQVLRERELDISRKQPRGIDGVLKSGARFDYVITVCDEGSAAGCPVFPGGGGKLHWSFPDPSALTGSADQRLQATRAICDSIAARVEQWCDEMCGAAR